MEYKVKRRPSKINYFLAVLIILVGAGIFTMLIVSTVIKSADNYKRVIVPGEKIINLDSEGRYTIFLEYESVIGSKVYSSSRYIPGLKCEIKPYGSNDSIEVTPARYDSNYSFNGHKGTSIFEFNIDKPGKYVLSASYDDNTSNEIVLAVGKGLVGRILLTVFEGIGILGGSIVIAVILTVVTFRKRRILEGNKHENYN